VIRRRRVPLLVCASVLMLSMLVPAVAPTAVSAAPAPARPAGGMWLLGADGGVFALAGARYAGGLATRRLNDPVVSLAATPSGHGYWIDAADGGIFSFGDARFYGSTGGLALDRPIVGMSPTHSGHGYWLVAADGGIFSFGDARFFGSTGGSVLNRPIVGMSPTPSGHGYWLLASDGGIFSFGDAHFYGSPGGQQLRASAVGIAHTATGRGYWVVTQIGAVFAYGDASAPASAPVAGAQVAGMVPTATGNGYWVAGRDGTIAGIGGAGPIGSVRPTAPIITVATRWASSGSSATSTAVRTAALIGAPGPFQAALTFDDGPDGTYTPQILAVLAAYRVPATFFTVGREDAVRPDLLQAEAAAGNSVEDHTWNHPDLTKLSATAAAGELSRTADAVAQATGVRPRCFRPPYEDTNAAVISIGANLGLVQTLWNVDPADWSRPGVGAIVGNVLSNARGRGVVILMHDGGGNRSQTVAALPFVIAGLRDQGYVFVLPCG